MRLLALFLCMTLSIGARAEERIISFHSDIRIAARGELTVVETIAVQVEGRQIKRGILRDFPTDYEDRYGRKVTVPFEVVQVLRDGRGEPHSESRRPNGVSVRIGDASVMLPAGRHVYEITYRTNFQVGFFEQHDELYWNVNGNGWTFAMDEVSADVELPSAVPAGDIKVEAYTGGFGARGRDYTAQARDSGAFFRTTRRLAAGEGLTIVFMFPKGIVAPPTFRDKARRWLHDNRGEAWGLGGLLVLLGFLYWRWFAVGRDPRAGPVFPRYEAPAGFGPGATRYVDQMDYDDRCFAAALLGLGQRGYLRIRQDGGAYEITRTGTGLKWLPGEAPLAALAPATGALYIGAGYDPNVQAARGGQEAELKAQYGENLFSRNTGSFIAGLFLAFANFGLMLMNGVAIPVVIAVAVAMVAALFFAARVLPAYTPEGRKVRDEIEGLRQYLSVAEKDDLARQKRPPRTKEEFAKFLPYAVALGVEKTWADTFAKVLGAAAVAAAAGAYYSSTDGDSSPSVDRFTDSLSGMGNAISSASSPPGSSSGSSDSGGSSSSDSGGSSGGGGGGGGGSGW